MVAVTDRVRQEAKKWQKSGGNIAKNGGVACGKRGYYDSWHRPQNLVLGKGKLFRQLAFPASKNGSYGDNISDK